MDDKIESTIPRHITYRDSLKYQQAGLILIMSGYKKSFLHLNWTSIKKSYKVNIEGQEMETYQIFVVPVGNTKIK